MRTPVLTPRGVNYNLDAADRASSRWPWGIGGLLLAALAVGLLLTFHARLGLRPPPKRSVAVPVVAEAQGALAQSQLLSPGETNRMPRWPASVDAEARRQMDGAEALVRADDLPSARRHYLELLSRGNLGAASVFVEQRLGDIGMQLLLTPRPMPEKTEHVVSDSETVSRIARQYGVTSEWLMKANDIRHPGRLQPAQRLLVLNKPVFSIAVDLRANELRLFLNGKFLKRYGIGAGRRGESPIGTYVIRSRQDRPTWWHPDGRTIPYGHRDNILGTRWMSLQATGTTVVAKGYGIHGTWGDDDVARTATAGGIRMRNVDIEELYLIVPEGTVVRVTE